VVFVDQTVTLAQLASSGDKEAITEQFIKSARACNSRHKKYREKKLT